MRKRAVILGMALVVIPMWVGWAQEPNDLPSYRILRAVDPIVVDGELTEASWTAAEPLELTFPWGPETGREPTQVRLLWDDAYLYVAFSAEDPNVSAVLTRRDDRVSDEDCVEVFVAPNAERVEDYYNFEINALGTLLDRAPFNNHEGTWNAMGIQIGISVDGTINDPGDQDQGWVTEVAIPFESLRAVAPNTPPKSGDTWRLNLHRCTDLANRQYSLWSDPQTKEPDFHTPKRFGIVAFSMDAVAPRPGIPSRETALEAMKKATRFMMDEVSYRGGFVDRYTEDLSEQWGEVPARRTMCWVQEPGTVSVGHALLEAFAATGDEAFLTAAKKAANALVWGQHPSGGWHYFFDFDPAGIPEWYEKVGSKCWGWEEFYHYYGNCTYDDDVTAGATDFLLDLYMTTLDPAYRAPLLKAMDFFLASQYPAGGWPQRFPLRHDHPSVWGEDYTAFYTFNDGVTVGNVHFLLKAYRQLGDPAFREAAIRGMGFVVLSQQGAPQAGWGQQHDMEMKPAGARSFEPPGLAPSTTAANIRNLMIFYKITGDRKYLRGIPDALAWLEKDVLPPGHSSEGHTHAQFVEVGTGKPLYAHREGTSIEDGRYWVDHEPGNFPGHYGMQIRVDCAALRKEYERVSALSPEEARAEYEAGLVQAPAVPEVSTETVRGLIESMDQRGAWVEDLSVPDYLDWKFRPRREFRGISTRTFAKNLRTFIHYLERH